MPMSRPNWFIGLPVRAGELPPDIVASLPAGIRRFHADDLHVTVAFLGAVGRNAADRAWSVTDWSRLPPLTAVTGPRASFGHPRRPSAYGLEIESDRLVRFIRDWRDVLLEAAGRPPETRDVRPHVTLGRPPRRRADAIRDRARRWVDVQQAGTPLRLDRIALYTWSDDRRERQFVRMRESVFGAAADTGHDDGADDGNGNEP